MTRCGLAMFFVLGLLETKEVRTGFHEIRTSSINGSSRLKSNGGASEMQKSTSCSNGSETVEGKEVTNEQMVSASDTSLPLVTVPSPHLAKRMESWSHVRYWSVCTILSSGHVSFIFTLQLIYLRFSCSYN
ncbi:PREDICTED: uncharacterized protein LOC104737572 [Camelina sativa]|uniref:Uncharacterized protein LOC104737572 n=1 Tax=Camelina sativa TaxID=90675 RepID=A0ABM0VH64_CAMSA|nr:PREDICTED: uncharacterized protein LOC104737572 [Camelina sativa]XP_010456078.1 PREDICTED: uncharacterized protein LOC104737572 [Camelina sativa]XP_010456080.1 PREDICTED: uncharacterized protein LOC104737572 [Camelina sativa]XP_010456081.1 PREDICTED: uncharacterized protein LOC104737572 [Camelina sativa]